MCYFAVCPELDNTKVIIIVPEGVVEYLLVAQCDSSAE